jgi:hypothetical protein
LASSPAGGPFFASAQKTRDSIFVTYNMIMNADNWIAKVNNNEHSPIDSSGLLNSRKMFRLVENRRDELENGYAA